MFQDLNDLLFIFYENDIKRLSNNMTKKIYLTQKPNHKHTIRKQYKDS